MFTDCKFGLCMIKCTKKGSERNLTEKLQPLTQFDLSFDFNCAVLPASASLQSVLRVPDFVLRWSLASGFGPVDYWTRPSPPTMEWRQDPAVSESPLRFRAALCDQNINHQIALLQEGQNPQLVIHCGKCLCHPGIHTDYLTILTISTKTVSYFSFGTWQWIHSLQYKRKRCLLYLAYDQRVTCWVDLHAGHTWTIISYQSK